MATTAAPADLAPLPNNRDEWPPAAYGAGAPAESYASYTRLRSGAWGIRVPGGCKPGQLVIARQRNGVERTERVRFVLWTGADKQTGVTVSLCTVEMAYFPKPKPAPQPTPAPSKRQSIPVIPTTPAARKPARSKRQPIPKLSQVGVFFHTTEDEEESKAQDAIDDARAKAEAALGADEPLF